MLLGKRPRPPIRRTTSMTGITIDHNHHQNHQHHQQQSPNELLDASPPPDPPADHHLNINDDYHQMGAAGATAEQESSLDYYYGNGMTGAFDGAAGDEGGGYDQYRFLATMVSPRKGQRSSSLGCDFVETADFLRTCGLCKRRLAPGKDIYMYRGDTAFCSLECREMQMKQDERREKCNAMAAMSKKEESHAHASRSSS